MTFSPRHYLLGRPARHSPARHPRARLQRVPKAFCLADMFTMAPLTPSPHPPLALVLAFLPFSYPHVFPSSFSYSLLLTLLPPVILPSYLPSSYSFPSFTLPSSLTLLPPLILPSHHPLILVSPITSTHHSILSTSSYPTLISSLFNTRTLYLTLASPLA